MENKENKKTKKKEEKELKQASIFGERNFLVRAGIFLLALGAINFFLFKAMTLSLKFSALNEGAKNAHLALESLERKIKNSSKISDGKEDFSLSQELFLIDNLSGEGSCYKFEQGALRLAQKVSSCQEGGPEDFETVLASARVNFEGGFYLKQGGGQGGGKQGLAQIVISVKYPKDEANFLGEKASSTLQIGVSLGE